MIQPDHPADIGAPDNPPRRSNGHSLAATPLRPPSFEASPTAQTDDAPAEMFSTQEVAEKFGRVAGAIYMASIVGGSMSGMDDPSMMSHYLQDLTSECNAQHDPMQRILLAQIMFAHHRAAQLHCSSANARSPEAMIGFNVAAAKMVAELRKLILTMKELQAISMASGTFKKVAKAQATETKTDQNEDSTKVVSNGTAETEFDKQNGHRKFNKSNGKKSKTNGSRPLESAEAQGINGRRATTTAGCDSEKPAVVGGNRTNIKRW